MADTHNLGLWSATQPSQPRDRLGRFVRVRHNAARRLILCTAVKMRVQMGLAPDPRLIVRTDK